MSTFPDIPTRGRPRRFGNAPAHLAVFAAAAFPLWWLHGAYSLWVGESSARDALGIAIAFLPLAYLVGWLPSLEAGRWRLGFRAFAVPLLIGAVSVYLYLAFRTFPVQPVATTVAVGVQWIVLVYLAMRTSF